VSAKLIEWLCAGESSGNSPAEEVLINDSVIEMVTEKVPDSVILMQIHDSKTNFAITPVEVIRLTKAGVSGTIIELVRNLTRVGVNVPDATPFYVQLAENVPADAEKGRPLRLTVTEAVKIGEAIVIPKGTIVTGSIVDLAGESFLGGDKMTYQLAQADAVDGTKLHVRALPACGKDGPAKHPIDSRAKGKTKEIAAAGSGYVASIDGDQTVSLRK
jgi:hypothetical protein